jgi:predicted nucleotidyltransferase
MIEATKFGLHDSIISQIQQIFSEFPSLEKVVLYGSRAKGTYHNGSDINLTFKGENLTAKTLYQIDEGLEELLLPYTFDLSLLKEIDNINLLEHIQRVGVTFYKP